MSLEDRCQHFKSRGTLQHEGKFNYSLVEYKDAKTKVKIICPNHGEFLQTPDKHLAPKSKGCQKCWEEIKTANIRARPKEFYQYYHGATKNKPHISQEIFIERCRKKYGNKFDYDLSNYNGLTKNKIKVKCPQHGEFETIPNTHLAKNNVTGCSKCGYDNCWEGKTHSYEEAVSQFNLKHNYIYDYPEYNKENYQNKKSSIDIICKKHGKFKKKAQKHLSGQGCFKCAIEKLIETNTLVGGYSEELFASRAELKNCKAALYYLEINNGKHYKIGITRTSIEHRISGIKCKAKNLIANIKSISIKEATLYECFKWEQQILNDNSKQRVFLPWSSEVFNTNIWEEIKHYFLPSQSIRQVKKQ